MNDRRLNLASVALSAIAVVLMLVFLIQPAVVPDARVGAQLYTNLTNLAVEGPTTQPTDEPVFIVDNDGVANAIEVRDGATPVFYVDSSGNTTISGTCSGCSVSSLSNLSVAVPTAVATATPGVVINNTGAANNLFELRDGGNVVFTVQNDGSVIFGTSDGTAFDVTWYSDTAGDTMLWDQSEEALTITGTNGQDALNVDDGNVDIADDLDVDGTTNLDDLDVDASGEIEIDGGLTDFGGGTYGTANGDNDVGIAGDLEVEGSVVLASGAYPLEFASSGYRVYVGSTSAFTGTAEIVSGTHGCTTAVSMALCQMQDPDDDSGDAFICVATISGSTVTINAIDTAGDAATEVDVVADYIIIGH